MITANEINAVKNAYTAKDVKAEINAIKSAIVSNGNETANDMPADEVILKIALLTLRHFDERNETKILQFIKDHWNE